MPAAESTFVSLGVLSRCRMRQLRNGLDLQLRDAPWRVFTILVLLVVIWAALYMLLRMVLLQIGRFELVAIVAHQHIFVHFFLVLAVMLAFSNAILAFSSLYGRREAGHLLAMPVQPRQVVCLKWLEGMFLSSWSFMLLGVPLMLAVARSTTVEWYYYPLFIAHFAGFVVIPATLGLLAAWVVAMYAPHRPLTVVFWGGALVLAGAGVWLWRLLRDVDDSDRWIETLFTQLSLAKQPLFPSTWTAKGIVAAMEKRVGLSLLYLGTAATNGLFLAWLVVNVIGGTWSEAYSRAQRSRPRPAARRGRITAILCELLFFYLPGRMRKLVLKDMRGFVRDATQWTQMVIMMGLLLIYAANLKRLPLDLTNPGMRALIAFLNLTTISLILATFTSRFVFPLLSLESQQLWLLGLLPTRRVTILLVKFVFALTLTGLSAIIVMGVSVAALELPADWARRHIAICLSICVGLCGLSVGLGARFPVLGQRNAARIASGFGGTLNLIASMVFVSIEMAGVAYLALSEVAESMSFSLGGTLDRLLLPVLVALGGAVAAVSLWIGARHFERLEY